MQQRTAKESAKHILAELRAGRLGAVKAGSCVYEDAQMNHCGVGCLFTTAQHKWIRDRGLLEVGISILVQSVGENNLAFVTGMNLDQLVTLQVLHDVWAKDARCDRDSHVFRFEEFLQNIIAA